MKIKNIMKPLVLASAISSIALLTACGGGGYESKNDDYVGQDLARSVTGYVVDDAVVGADVKIYALDLTKSNWKGEVLVSGKTDSNGKFVDLSIPAFTFDKAPFIVESTGGTLKGGGAAPLQKMNSIVANKDLLGANIFTYVTPLSTFVLEYAQSRYALDDSAALKQNLKPASETVLDSFQDEIIERFAAGLVSSEADIFTAPVQMDENILLGGSSPDVAQKSKAQNAVNLRAANGILLALLERVKQATSASSLDEVLAAVAKDQADGRPDGKLNGEVIAELAGVTEENLFIALTPDVADIPNLIVPGSNVPVKELLNSIEGVTSEVIASYGLSQVTSPTLIVPGKSTVKVGCVDGKFSSGASYPCPNAAPVLEVGNPLRLTNVAASEITIDTVGTVDSDGDALTYTFTEISGASEANYTLNAGATSATFVSTVAGDYQVKVVVNDGKLNIEKTVKITVLPAAASNNPPVIGAGSLVSESNPDPFIGTLTMAVASVADADSTSTPKYTTEWACEFVRFGVLPPESVKVTSVKYGSDVNPSLSVTVEKKPFEGTYNCTLKANDGYVVAEKIVSVETNKNSPASLAMFGLGLGLLALLGLRRKK